MKISKLVNKIKGNPKTNSEFIKKVYFVDRRLAPSTRMITEASSSGYGSIQSSDLQLRVRWWRTISLGKKIEHV